MLARRCAVTGPSHPATEGPQGSLLLRGGAAMRSVRIIAAVLLAAAVAATGCTAHATVHPAAAPAPASYTPPPTTTADPTPNSPAGGPTAPTTTLALGR